MKIFARVASRFVSPAVAFLATVGGLVCALPAQDKSPLQDLLKQATGKADDRSRKAVKPVARFGPLPNWVTDAAFDPAGARLAIGTYRQVRVYAAAGWKLERELATERGFVRALAFSPDGKTLAVGHFQSAELWSVPEGRRLLRLEEPRGYVTGIDFSPDGKLLAVASEDERVRIWEVGRWDASPVTLSEHTYPVVACRFSPNGKLLLTVAGDDTRPTRPGEAFLWKTADWSVATRLKPHERPATDGAFSHDGRYVATTSFDETVRLYDAKTGQVIGYFGAHARPTTRVRFFRTRPWLVSASGGRARGKNEVKVFDCEAGREVLSFEPHTARVSALALSPDDRFLCTGGYDKVAAVWDLTALLPGAGGKPGDTADATTDRDAGPDRGTRPAQDASSTPQAQPAGAKPAQEETTPARELKVGIIGLDTSHAIAFTRVLNAKDKPPQFRGCRVVAAYPRGSPDIPSSVNRIPRYTEQIRQMGVAVVDSIPELLRRVDVVLLETNDGRPHLEQALQVFRAGKPVFIDKPLAASLADVVAIYRAADHFRVPVFSSSALRFSSGAQAARQGKWGRIVRCETFSPCHLEKTHPDLFWYGIHGVELLYTVMKTGCRTVRRTVSTAELDEVVGEWSDGRTGIFRGYRKNIPRGNYGGQVTLADGTTRPLTGFEGYEPLLVEIVQFFRTHRPPVSAEETIELYAFMYAADVSKQRGGTAVSVQDVLQEARRAAAERLKTLAPETLRSKPTGTN